MLPQKVKADSKYRDKRLIKFNVRKIVSDLVIAKQQLLTSSGLITGCSFPGTPGKRTLMQKLRYSLKGIPPGPEMLLVTTVMSV